MIMALRVSLGAIKNMAKTLIHRKQSATFVHLLVPQLLQGSDLSNFSPFSSQGFLGYFISGPWMFASNFADPAQILLRVSIAQLLFILVQIERIADHTAGKF